MVSGATAQPRPLRFGRFEVDTRSGELRKDGLRVRLPEQPFQVLALLLERPGEVVTREELQRRLWPADTFVGFDHGLNNAVRRLRDALGDSVEAPRFIETLPKVGYRFVAAVQPIGEASPEASAAAKSDGPRQRPALVALAAGSLGALIATAVVAARKAPVPEPPRSQFLTHSGHDRRPAVSPDRATVAFVSGREGRQRIWLAKLRTGEEAPLTAGPRDDEPRFSSDGSAVLFTRVEPDGSAALFRVSSLGGEPRQVLAQARAGDWSADGRRLAFIRWAHAATTPSHVLGVAAADGAGARELAGVSALWMTPPRWSPDGRTVAVAHGEGASGVWTILLVEVDTGRVTRMAVPERAGSGVSAPAWAPSGRALLLAHPESAHGNFGARLVRREIGSERSETLLRSLGFGLGFDVVGESGVVFEQQVRDCGLREVALGSIRRPPQGDGSTSASKPDPAQRWITRGAAEDRQPVYPRAGARLVFSSNRSGSLDLWELSLETGALRRLTDSPADDMDPAVTGDGRLLWSSNRSGAFEIWMAEPDGSTPRQVSHDGFDAENPSATPDGSWIVYASSHPEKRGLWKVRPDGSQARRLVSATVGLPEVSPDGRYVLFSEYNPPHITLRAIELASGNAVPFEQRVRTGAPFLPAPRFIRGRARWMPDGQAIAFTDLDSLGRPGVVVQDFRLSGGSGAARPIAGFERDSVSESFAIAPDGKRLILSTCETSSNLAHASGLRLDP